jgi:hypothetical protein
VVVNDLNLLGIPFAPSKADAPLTIDTNAVLSGALAGQLLDSIARRAAKIVQGFGGVQNQQLTMGYPLQLDGPPPHAKPLEDLLGVAIPEALDHSE